MTDNTLMVRASLLSIVLLSVHFADDVVRGMSGGGLENLIGILILVVWLYGTLVLPERRVGQVIILVGAFLAAAMPAIHMRGAGVGGTFAQTDGAFLFIWTLLALGVTASLTAVLAARALWRR